MIGRNLTLWKAHYSDNAYKDHVGRSHSAYIVTDEVLVQIVDEKEVKGDWSGDIYEAWKASDERGNFYTCNWNYFPEGSSMPTYYWTDFRGELWIDAEQATFLIFVDTNGNLKPPPI